MVIAVTPLTPVTRVVSLLLGRGCDTTDAGDTSSDARSSSGASSDAAPGVRVRHMPAEKLRAAIRCVMAAAGCPESEQAQVAELLVACREARLLRRK